MEITKRGALPGERPWHGSCPYCGSTATAKAAELKVQRDQRNGDLFAWAVCPVCGEGNCRYAGMLFRPARCEPDPPPRSP